MLLETALVKREARDFFEKGIVKDYVLPLVDEITKDVIEGNPPDLERAIRRVVEDRIWDKFTSSPKKLLHYVDKSM